MIPDPVGILGLVHSLSTEWRNPTEVVISPLADIKNEPAYKKALAEGFEFGWVAQRKIRSMSRDGWKPLTERDKIGRPTVFVDKKRDLLAMIRPTDG